MSDIIILQKDSGNEDFKDFANLLFDFSEEEKRKFNLTNANYCHNISEAFEHAERIINDTDGSVVYLIKKNNINVGFSITRVYGSIVSICMLFIKEEYRKQGLGSSIIKHSIKNSEIKKILGVILCVAKNNTAKLFYENLGFRYRCFNPESNCDIYELTNQRLITEILNHD